MLASRKMWHENRRAQSPEGQDCRCQGRRQPGATPEYLAQFVKSEIESCATPIKASGVTVDCPLQHRARGLPGLSQLDFAVGLVGEADAAERHRRAGGEGLIALEPALRKGLTDRLFDLALGGHAERLEKLPNAGVEDVFVHGHLLCTCPSGHGSPVLACPVVYHLRPPSPALACVALAGGRSPLLALRSRPTIQIVASACRRCRRLDVQNSCHEETSSTF